MAKIYLSSTYSDLKKHREAVYKTLMHFGHDVVALEDYGSSDNRPIDKCFDDINECDIYIGIIAWRYGYIPPGDIKIPIPNEIFESLNRFKKDHEKSKKIAFIMMQFGNTKLHGKILDAIKKCLEPSNIKAVRADEKEYHDDLYYNILTYIYGCSFGIAVFERIDNDNFNPNVTLEVGHMLALGKKVCFLKDITLPALSTDLIGKLYKTFDPQNMSNTIKHSVLKWADDRSLL